MFEGTKTHTVVDSEIARLIMTMQKQDQTSKEYDESLKRLRVLNSIRQDEKPSRVNTDVVINAVANLAGIFLIIKHESVNVIASRALMFVTRLR